MPTQPKPTNDEARAAIVALENAIREDSSSARAPWKRNTPDDTPIWKPERWTLKYMQAKKSVGGWVWGMDSTNQQVVTYAYTNPMNEIVTWVTHNGTERMYARKQVPFHPTAMFKDWFPGEVKYKKQVIEI